MFRILCFGDSNTWGYNPANGLRFSEKDRWPGVLRKNIGGGFEILEEGKNGRRVLGGLEEFNSTLLGHHPLDVIIIYLGINDICFEKDVRLDDILEGMDLLLESVRENYSEISDAAPEIILIGAVSVNEVQLQDGLYDLEAEKIVRYSDRLRSLAESNGFGYVDAGKIIKSSPLDGIHLDSNGHRTLGLFIADYLGTFLSNTKQNNKS